MYSPVLPFDQDVSVPRVSCVGLPYGGERGEQRQEEDVVTESEDFGGFS